MMRSVRLRWVIATIALLVVLVIVVPHGGGRSKTLPPGPFGATLRCLERNALFEPRDVSTGALPTAATRDVRLGQARGPVIAELREAGSPGAARRIVARRAFGSIDPADGMSDGAIAWAYAFGGTPPHVLANAGDRTLVDFCVRTPDRR